MDSAADFHILRETHSQKDTLAFHSSAGPVIGTSRRKCAASPLTGHVITESYVLVYTACILLNKATVTTSVQASLKKGKKTFYFPWDITEH